MNAFLVEEEVEPDNQAGGWNMRGSHNHSSRSRISGSEQVVEFMIGDERFGVDLFDVSKILLLSV